MSFRVADDVTPSSGRETTSPNRGELHDTTDRRDRRDAGPSVPGAELTNAVRGDRAAATAGAPALVLIGTPLGPTGS
jgi:hypothetical protein